MNKSLSVVIPVFNRSSALLRALESLACQTDKDFDVMVCDDGSDEDIRSVVDHFRNQLDIHYLRLVPSGSPSRPRNVGIQRSEAEWISFLDSDDWWTPGRVQAVKAEMHGSDLVYHKLTTSYGPDRSVPRRRQKFVGQAFRGDLLISMLCYGNPFATSGTTIRRQYLIDAGGMWEAPSGDAIDDFDMWLKAVMLGARVTFIDTSLGWYEVSPDSISKFSQKQYIRQRRLFRRQMTLLPNEIRSLAHSHFEYALGTYALRLRNYKRATIHFGRINPLRRPRKALKAYIHLAFSLPTLIPLLAKRHRRA